MGRSFFMITWRQVELSENLSPVLVFRFVPMGRKRILETLTKNREEGLDQQTYKNGASILLRMSTLAFARKWNPCVPYIGRGVSRRNQTRPGHFQLTKTELFEAVVSPPNNRRGEGQPPKASSTLPSTACLAREAMLGRGEPLPHLLPPKVYELPVYRRMGWKLLRSHLDDATRLISTKNRC